MHKSNILSICPGLQDLSINTNRVITHSSVQERPYVRMPSWSGLRKKKKKKVKTTPAAPVLGH
jgi:hypothetical protein